MNRIATVGFLALAASLSSLGVTASSRASEMAKGVVFHDANHNKKRDADERGLPGVRVSNGREIVTTNENGEYSVQIDSDDIVFVIKPRNWRTPVSRDLLPRFYYIHKPQGSPKLKFAGVEPTGPLPESIDFPLYPKDEPKKFQAIMFGDPQPRDRKELNFVEHDVIEELIGTKAAFGVTLGDIVFDDLSLLEPQARSIAVLGIPWYNVIGNHDINLDAKDDAESDETFERVFGPSYYSFDHGPVHFVVLDNIHFAVNQQGKGGYQGGLGEQQLTFLKNDLALVPDNQMVVLLMHIPLIGTRDRQAVYRLIEKRPFCISVSGHTHHHEHVFIDSKDGWKGKKPHHHIINVTVSGSWWSGAPDERMIPHTMMADGAPNGYSIFTFDGTQYTLDFKAAGRPASYQMNIQSPETIAAGETNPIDVYVNVFNGSKHSKVEMRVADKPDWAPLNHVREIDPLFAQTSARENAIEKKTWRNLPKPKPSSHLWKGKLPTDLPPGSQLIRIRVTDRDGRIMHGSRILKVTTPAGDAE